MSQQFVWNNAVRVTIGEMTRADHFDYSRDIQVRDDMESSEWLMTADNALVAHSPTLIEVCVDGQWQEVTAPFTLGTGIDKMLLKPKMDMNDVARLPLSLFQQWSQAATEANPFIRNLFLSVMNSPTATTASSDGKSAVEPSSAPVIRSSTKTKTTGSKTTRKT
jgi:hypothetical protein